MTELDKEEGDPKGNIWYTFTFKLPFTLGLTYSENESHIFFLNPISIIGPDKSAWRRAGAEQAFGKVPIVRMKFLCHPVDGFDLIPENGDKVMQQIYGEPLFPDGESAPLYGEGGKAYEQWVSLETPGSRLVWENIDDRGYAFHRCLTALNEFLTAYILAFGQKKVHPVNTQDLGAIIYRGAYDTDKKWHKLGPLFMHPETLPEALPILDMKEEAKKLESATLTVFNNHPYLQTKIWYWRALRAERRGDHIDQIVSLQTSVESMLFSTWRMILVDQHMPLKDINKQLERYVTYEELIKNIIPRLLEGPWDRTKKSTPLNLYWTDLYLIRNRIVHAGYNPQPNEAYKAHEAYKAMRKFVNDRVWDKRKEFPRTMLARIGRPELFNYEDDWVKSFLESIKDEGYTWWLPYDIAGRE